LPYYAIYTIVNVAEKPVGLADIFQYFCAIGLL